MTLPLKLAINTRGEAAQNSAVERREFSAQGEASEVSGTLGMRYQT
jgi:hypothetical protein